MPAALRNGSTRVASSRVSIRMMCWLFIQSSFSVLNTALADPMPSRAKRAVRSSTLCSSLSSPGDQPSRARKFNIASGR